MYANRVRIEYWIRAVFVILFFIGAMIVLGMFIRFVVLTYEASGAYEIIKARDLLSLGW